MSNRQPFVHAWLQCEVGTPVAIFAHGKEHPMAIGVCKMSTADIKSINKGIGVDNLHHLNDGLWKVRVSTQNRRITAAMLPEQGCKEGCRSFIYPTGTQMAAACHRSCACVCVCVWGGIHASPASILTSARLMMMRADEVLCVLTAFRSAPLLLLAPAGGFLVERATALAGAAAPHSRQRMEHGTF